nr:unnamed protein product [Callosobruchus chinensis]
MSGDQHKPDEIAIPELGCSAFHKTHSSSADQSETTWTLWILCIDEATANVDEDTDRLIQSTLRTAFRKSTVITIAHRIQTILDSDRVLVMSDGKIAEFDSPDNLLEDSESMFYKLVRQE